MSAAETGRQHSPDGDVSPPARWLGRAGIRRQRLRWWQVRQLQAVAPRLAGVLDTALVQADAGRTLPYSPEQTVTLELARAPLLPETWLVGSLTGDRLHARWLASRVAGNPRLHVWLCARLTGRLLRCGIDRSLRDHEAPGPWTVGLLALCVEKEQRPLPIWNAMLAELGDARPADATFLALWCSEATLAEMRTLLNTAAPALAAGVELLDLALALRALMLGTPKTPLGHGPLARAWYEQRTFRGLRRHQARIAGISAAAEERPTWPAWLAWDGDTTPRALCWMAAEWWLAWARSLPPDRRNDVLGSELLPLVVDTADSRGIRKHVALPGQLVAMCHFARDGEEISGWALQELVLLMGADGRGGSSNRSDRRSEQLTIGRFAQRPQGERP